MSYIKYEIFRIEIRLLSFCSEKNKNYIALYNLFCCKMMINESYILYFMFVPICVHTEWRGGKTGQQAVGK